MIYRDVMAKSRGRPWNRVSILELALRLFAAEPGGLRAGLDHHEVRVGEGQVRGSWAMWTAPPAALPLLS